uniref:Elongation of very long chain fatty acids protein n=1 Tax=Strigamia maritima TaxID=126957 RepID=T1IMY2_STRMM
MGFLETLSFVYYYFNQKGDQRVQDWPLMRTPWPSCVITCVYFILVHWGRKLMKNRPAYNLKSILIPYNIAMMSQSAYIFKEILMSAYHSNFSLTCEPLEKVFTPQAMRIASASWWFFISKIVEMCDTVFLILRKKEEQLTFLHIFHHGTMVFNQWLACKFIPGGHAFIQGMLNSLIHVVMYGYYFLSALGPKIQKYLWWKKYITTLQLCQFFIIIFHNSMGSLINCDFPWWVAHYGSSYSAILFILFYNFYMKSYKQKRR